MDREKVETALLKLVELFGTYNCEGKAEICEFTSNNGFFLLITDLRGDEDSFCAAMPDEIDGFPVYFGNEFQMKFIGEEVS